MVNSDGAAIDMYIPRKCSATNRLIHSKDKASVQLNVGHVNADGVYTGEFTTMAMCGFVRSQGEADGAFDELFTLSKKDHNLSFCCAISAPLVAPAMTTYPF